MLTHNPLLVVLAYSAGFVLVGLLLRAVSYRGPKPAAAERGQTVLQYTRGRKVVGWVVAYVANGIGCWLVLTVLDQPQPPWEWLTMTVLAAVATVYGFVEIHRAHVVFDDERISMRRAWGSPVSVLWEDIERVRYNDMIYMLAFMGKDGGRFRISRAIGNFGLLLKQVRKKIAGRRFVDSGTSNLIATDLTKS